MVTAEAWALGEVSRSPGAEVLGGRSRVNRPASSLRCWRLGLLWWASSKVFLELMEPEEALESESSEKSLFSSRHDYEESQEADETGTENPLLQPTLTGDVEGLQKIFEDPENPHHENAVQLLLEEDIVGRNLLYAACMAGKSDVIRALAKYGVNLNEKTARGYTLLHCAAAWGRLETLKALVELDVDIEALNFRGEKARDVAARYSQAECVHFLDRADARLILKKFITKSSLIITDPEKTPGKLFKEDKNAILNACRMKNEWLESHPEASISELFVQKQQLEDIVSPIIAKMSTPHHAVILEVNSPIKPLFDVMWNGDTLSLPSSTKIMSF